ncbi:MAG TPA: 2-oxoglutarate and iron-dependent oxygenase domain-containing protein [Caulobacteraceae bacterium]|jgi:isopenicillin N synthase-like dioxygenase
MTRHVPTLDLTDFTDGDPLRRAAFSAAMFEALKDYGFFVLVGHEVPEALLDRAYARAEQTFALPEDHKRRYAAGLRGYTPFGVEHAKDSGRPDLKEFWQIGHEPAPGITLYEPFPPNVWPTEIEGFHETFQALFHGLNRTGMTLLQALARPLGVEDDYFDELVRWGTSILRVLHYPPVADDVEPGCVRSAAHEDINFITIMVGARGAGLELQDRDGSWLPVASPPGGLIVDSGDMLQRLTNGLIPATTHRVVNPVGPNVSRYSMPFFMHPTLETSLAPLPSCLGDGPKHPVTTAGEYLHERLKAIGLAT